MLFGLIFLLFHSDPTAFSLIKSFALSETFLAEKASFSYLAVSFWASSCSACAILSLSGSSFARAWLATILSRRVARSSKSAIDLVLASGFIPCVDGLTSKVLPPPYDLSTHFSRLFAHRAVLSADL